MSGAITTSVTDAPLHSITVEREGTDELLRRFVRADGARCGVGDAPLGVCRIRSTTDEDLIPVDTAGVLLVETGGAIGVGETIAPDAQGRAVRAERAPLSMAVVDGAAADTDIAVAGIRATDDLVSVVALDGTAVPGPSIDSDGNIQSTGATAGKKLLVVWRGPERPVAGRALRASSAAGETIAALIGLSGVH